jgi:2-polyprenyl-3-methyl-5-hydroxy-6-metoxy-1,4-benzoquinol methylase
MIQQSHQSVDDTYYNRDRSSIYPHVCEGENVVLDLGCGAGVVGRRLIELKRAKSVVGVEIFKPVADEAAKFYDKVYQGDIEIMDLDYQAHFDYVICADILEHLREPQKVLTRIHQWLKPDGKLICSVPNVRNWRVVRDLLVWGDWEYQDSGIMDETHLRFFTRKSCIQLIAKAGFKVEFCRMLTYGRKKRLISSLTFGFLDEFLGTQLISLSRKSNGN